MSCLGDTLSMEIRRLPEFDRWLERLRDRTAVLRITRRIARLEMGNAGDFKSVGEGILELRIDHGPGYRVYFVKQGDKLILLLCGGDKAAQQKDIAHATILARRIKD